MKRQVVSTPENNQEAIERRELQQCSQAFLKRKQKKKVKLVGYAQPTMLGSSEACNVFEQLGNLSIVHRPYRTARVWSVELNLELVECSEK